MRRAGLLRAFFAAAALAAAPAFVAALEEHSLLTPDGTLHVVRTGSAAELGVDGVAPDSLLVEHASRAQDGATTLGIVPDSVSYQQKRGIQLGYDEESKTLLLIWTEDISAAYSHIRVGVLKDGAWTNMPLLPSQGIARSHNPQMRITHQRVTYLDESDVPVAKTSSIVTVVWWEESTLLQARLAALFLDENSFDPSNLAIYDLPALGGGQGASVYSDVPSGAYLFPTLQADGLSGAVLVSYADLHADQHRVARISFPEDQGQPSDATDTRWKRRHIPIYGVYASGPVARMTPSVAAHAARQDAVGASIGSGYKPTLYWLDGTALKFTRLAGADWEPVRSIAIDESMTYDRALELVVGMGTRN
jgi:hypothetical protein